MSAAKSKQTDQDSKDTELILYRLGIVEAGVKDLGSKLDRQDNIKKADLHEFRQFITDRMIEFKASLQSQIDKLDEDKASNQEFKELKRQIYSAIAFIATLAVTAFAFLLNKL